jgi:hypothetical protein
MESPERFEFKFLLGGALPEDFLAQLGDALTPDRQGGSAGVYPVVSLYYDTPDLRCYWEAWRKVPSRRKLRVRVYGSADGRIAATSFIEIKHKVNGLGFKRRLQAELAEALDLVEGRQSAADLPAGSRRIVEEAQHFVREEGFVPCCTIRYLRHAYWLDADRMDESARGHPPLRVTVDSTLMVRFENLRPKPDDKGFSIQLLPAGTRVLEIKGTGAMPFALAQRLARAGIRASGMSKYCKAVEHLLHQNRPSTNRPHSIG